MTANSGDDTFGERTARHVKRALQLICLAALAVTLMLGVAFLREARNEEMEKRDELLRATQAAATQIDTLLQPVGEAASGLAARLSRGEVAPAGLEAALRAMVEANDIFFGGTVAYRPFGHDPARRLYAPYVLRGSSESTQLGDDYDYTLPDPGSDSKTEWYVKPMGEGGRDGWSSPYFDPSLGTTMITYSAIFRSPGATPQKNGVVTIDVSTDRLKKIIRELKVGPGGFGAMTTAEGVYLYHPDERLVRERKTLTEAARERRDPNRLLLAEAALARASGVLTHRSTTTGARSWLVYAPLPTSGWSLQVTFVRNDVPAQVDDARHQLVWITISGIVFLASLALLLLRAHQGRTARLWAGTAAVSLLLLAGVGTIWALALNLHGARHDLDGGLGKEAQIAITDRDVLAQIKDAFERQRRDRRQPQPLFIPTGIHIESMELDGSNTVSVTGQVWQKFPLGKPTKGLAGVSFSGAKDVRFTPVEEQVDEGRQLVIVRSGFQFNLRTQFDFSRYPLEVESIGIGLEPVERSGALALVPDLDSYNIMLASQKPGLAPELRLRGWTLESTSFVLRPQRLNSKFGLETSVDLEQFPQLVYEIGLKRIFVDAFISNLTPLIVVAIVLFSLLLLPESVGIKEILGFSVSLFFVVVFAHLSIRRSIASGQIFYLEYFFLVTYFALLAVPINAFRRALQVPYPLLEYRGGLVMKVLYWPVMLGIFFVITALQFY